MGQRANLIIVKRESYDFYYSHWCANTLPRDIFWGPEFAINFIEMQVKVDIEDWWLDDVWAEGGVIVDIEKKVLLLYGGEDILFDIPLRRIYLKLLSQVWSGWQIRWAYEGIADIADYVEYPRKKVLTKSYDDYYNVSLEPPEEKDWIDTIGSVKLMDNSMLIFPLAGYVEEYLINGPKKISNLNATYGYKEINIADWTSNFLSGGFHIDFLSKSVDFWAAHDVPGVIDRIKKEWDGLKINWHLDKFEMHIENTKGNIKFQDTTNEGLLNHLRKILLYNINESENAVLEYGDKAAEEGKKVEINLLALRNEKLKLDRAVCDKIIDAAIESLKI